MSLAVLRAPSRDSATRIISDTRPVIASRTLKHNGWYRALMAANASCYRRERVVYDHPDGVITESQLPKATREGHESVGFTIK
jgi:hypothetical protein